MGIIGRCKPPTRIHIISIGAWARRLIYGMLMFEPAADLDSHSDSFGLREVATMSGRLIPIGGFVLALICLPSAAIMALCVHPFIVANENRI